MAKRLFSYAGSKHKYKKQIQEVVAKLNINEVETYIEPFAGSLGSFFHIMEKINAKRIIINDINPKITNIYQQIKNDPEQVIKAYTALEKHFQELLPTSIKTGLVKKDKRPLMQDARDFYLWVREYVNTALFTANHAAAMIFVLNHYFNGLYQENKKGEFNSAFNWNAKRIDIEEIVNIINKMHLFFIEKNVEITTMDIFELLALHQNPNTFIYLDPPYINNTIKYVANAFDVSLPNQMKLIYMTLKYQHVMYSNHHHDAFADFFDEHINFYRTNKVSGSKKEKKPPEIMAYKTNISEVMANNTSYKLIRASFNEPA